MPLVELQRMICLNGINHVVPLSVSSFVVIVMNNYLLIILFDSKSSTYLELTNFMVVRFLLGNSPASEFDMQTFQNTLSVPSS